MNNFTALLSLLENAKSYDKLLLMIFLKNNLTILFLKKFDRMIKIELIIRVKNTF